MPRVRRAEARYVEVRLKRIHLERAGRTVLREVDWTVRPGERWVLAGGNGSGKTQLLKLISGAVWPTPTDPELGASRLRRPGYNATAGAAGAEHVHSVRSSDSSRTSAARTSLSGSSSRIYRWAGHLWTTPADVKEEIAYVGPERQDKYERYEWNHTVTQIIGTGLYRTDIPLDPLTKVDQRKIESILKRLDIAHLANRGFLSLSYGERRLTLLARALASQPKLLLLDELLNGLDATHGARAGKWLESTGRSQLPWILATHRSEDVPSCATHALILDQGRVIYRGPLSKAPLAKWLDHEPADPAKQARSVPKRTGKPIIRLDNASVWLDEAVILDGLSFEVHAGECWVVHGSNGSGKTTLLRTLYGDFGVAVGGRIQRAGIEPGVPLEEFKKRAGFVAAHLQANHSHSFTVSEIVQSGLHASIGLNDAPTAADRAAARRALTFFDLKGFDSRTRVELSYGQMRRVLFARAWISHPRLLLLDEPLAGVDAPTRRVLLDRIGKLVEGGTAVVMSTHHREEWPPYATHELELAAGKMRYVGAIRWPDENRKSARRAGKQAS